MQNKAIMSKITVYTRTIKVILSWKITGRLQTASRRSISIFGIYLLLIESKRVKCE